MSGEAMARALLTGQNPVVTNNNLRIKAGLVLNNVSMSFAGQYSLALLNSNTQLLYWVTKQTHGYPH
jgi:hypothetical protein